MSFKIKTTVFEGPLDVLLTLIEKRKLFINDISLAKIADDYIAYVNNLGQFPIADGANFVLIASTLLLIKSKSLLPSLSLTDEEEGSIRDLETRLKIYKRLKEASVYIKNNFGGKISFAFEERKIDPIFSPDKKATVTSIFEAIKNVLADFPQKDFLPKVIVEKVISLEDMIDNLTKRVANQLKISFKEFSKTHRAGKVNIIVSFLAMLELFKRGVISVTQDKHFSDITMETEHIGVPKY